MEKNIKAGFGTGCLYKIIDPASKEAIDKIKSTNANAIELCGVLKKRFDKTKENFFNLNIEDLKDFSYISLHAPDDVVYDNNPETIELLNKIDELNKKLNFNLIVFHPDVIKDFSIFCNYNFPIAFENMDNRKKSFKFVEDFSELLKNEKFGLVIDLTHAYTCDLTGELAERFIEKYKDKIKQIHCSGNYSHGEDNQQHFPAYLEVEYYKKIDTPNNIILSNIPMDIPIIIESVFPKETIDITESLKKEFNFIIGFIKRL